MQKLLLVTLTLVLVVSCSSIENATSKWKTPDEPGAGLAEGEKSSYLDNKDTKEIKTPAETKPAKKKKKTKKK